MKKSLMIPILVLLNLVLFHTSPVKADAGSYPIVDTGQNQCYDNHGSTNCPQAGQAFYGQDASYDGLQPAYRDNGDGTVTDLNTGLMWQQTPDLENQPTWEQALAEADSFTLGGYTDWRLPTIKELYSLINFTGSSPLLIPYIDINYFDFAWGDESSGERIIDAQYWSATEYVGTTMGGQPTTFGVNFADGRIKGYGRTYGGTRDMTQFVRYVRGNTAYGVNDFVDNGDGTVTDQATGLTWQQVDSGRAMTWQEAIGYAENLEYAGHSDWRLPNAKELQSIVDYSRAPDAADPAMRTAAIDPIFSLTETESYFWTGTTLREDRNGQGIGAVYIAFGRAMGYMFGEYMNVHGAGAQRSDPKVGDPGDYPEGHGPQGDDVRIHNYVRCVRGGS